MPDLLFISNNPKVEQIRDLLQPVLKLEIGVATHVERTPEDASGHQPAIICIQERLGGITAGEIVRQIQATRTAPENSLPLFVLLREGNDTTAPHEQYFEHVIDVNQPVEQLAKNILRVVLRPAFRLRWSDIYIDHDRDEAGMSAPGRGEAEYSGAGPALPKGQIPAELLKAFERNYHSRRRDRWLQYAAVFLTACLAVSGWYLASGRYDQSGRVPPTAPSRPAVQPAAVTTPPQARKNIPTTPAAAIAQNVSSALGRPGASKATAAKLPSFIPEKGRDRAYSRRKPGWERYTNAHYEFRILRSGGRIKAIQVLAATPRAISEAFLKSALSEITGSSTYRETSQKEKHGFLIRRGSAGAGATITIYTRKSRIRAFVISTG